MNQDDKKQSQEKNQMHPVAAAVTGAVVGAGVAVAGTVALSSKKNREKVKKALAQVKDQAIEYIGDMQKQAPVKDIKKKLADGKKGVTNSTKHALHIAKA